MEKTARMLILLCLAIASFGAGAQDVPPAPPYGAGAPSGSPPGFGGPAARLPMRPLNDWTPEQREQFREERRQRREAWMQMSPEERHQLRRDIRDAGQRLYPYGRHRGRD